MDHFSALHVVFSVEAETPICLSDMPGSALRGAFIDALLGHDFQSSRAGEKQDVLHALVDTYDPDAPGGQEIPRGFTIEPPVAVCEWQAGECFEFGLTLFGTFASLLPHVCRAVYQMGERGVGKGRGRFRVVGIGEQNPLDGTRAPLLRNHQLRTPRFMVTQSAVLAEAAQRDSFEVTLTFLTPMRLVSRNHLVKAPALPVLVHHLVKRAEALDQHCSPTPGCPLDRVRLIAQAEKCQCVVDDTRWRDATSFSSRQHKTSPVGGFIGRATWRGDLTELLPLLLWGQSLHVGRNAVKGAGWYVVE